MLLLTMELALSECKGYLGVVAVNTRVLLAA